MFLDARAHVVAPAGLLRVLRAACLDALRRGIARLPFPRPLRVALGRIARCSAFALPSLRLQVHGITALGVALLGGIAPVFVAGRVGPRPGFLLARAFVARLRLRLSVLVALLPARIAAFVTILLVLLLGESRGDAAQCEQAAEQGRGQGAGGGKAGHAFVSNRREPFAPDGRS
ncbi:MAG TPA: hypothetical protein PKD02_04910 [Thermomonas sp.]|nr:hypothetical protein [Thermomonas sp.]